MASPLLSFAAVAALGIMSFALLSACSTLPAADYSASPQHHEGRFRNAEPDTRPRSLGRTARLMWQVAFNKPADAVPDRALPVQRLSQAELLAAPDASLWRLSHSTVLIKLGGGFWLTDPVYAERAFPVQWLGPKRFHEMPIALDELPPLRAVILSHDHYDHLDPATLQALAAKTGRFVAPLGVGDRLIAWGVPADKVTQLDWWQETVVDGMRLVCTPARHFSGRGLNDGNRTLWASWVMAGGGARVFFSGDTGYFDGFKAIGERLGPFDVALVETGAYNLQWPDVHMQPEQSLQAHLDLRARLLVPVHNGSFDLALHGWHEPLQRITALARARGVAVATPRFGRRQGLHDAGVVDAWWQAR